MKASPTKKWILSIAAAAATTTTTTTTTIDDDSDGVDPSSSRAPKGLIPFLDGGVRSKGKASAVASKAAVAVAPELDVSNLEAENQTKKQKSSISAAAFTLGRSKIRGSHNWHIS